MPSASDAPRWQSIVAVGVPSNAIAGANAVTASVLKAACLYNFAKFAEWPTHALAPGQRLSLCVAGDNAVAEALEQTIKGRGIDNPELTVEVIKTDSHSLPLLSSLYVSSLNGNRAGQLLDSLKNTAPSFTVSDGDQFAEMGGIAQLITGERPHAVLPCSTCARRTART